MQELERERLRLERAEGVAADNQERTNVKFMISGEAPVLMSKACELLIKDLSFRAWQHTERNRRRTLQRQDLHAAVGESEVYDFLIDIVPRVQTTQTQAPAGTAAGAVTAAMSAPDMSMMQASIPTYHQIPQMATALNTTTMQQTAQAMAAAVPIGAPPPAGTQPGPAPSIVPVPPGVVDTSNPQSGMIAYAPAVPTDALNHLAQWDPSQMPFQAPVQAPVQYQVPHQVPDGQHQAITANPVQGNAPPPQHLQQQPEEKQEQLQQPPQMQMQLQHPGQWMDPAAIAGMTGASPNPPAAAGADHQQQQQQQPTPGV